MALRASEKIDFPVAISGHEDKRFAAHYFPARDTPRRVLQVLVHGVSYDHRYWNADIINGQDYSYVAYMAQQGFDVLAIDLPGVGDSDTIDGHEISLEAVGSSLSNLVRSIKEQATLRNYAFKHISLIGHSMGAAISVYSQARWPAADSLVVTATGFFPGRPRTAWAPGAREALLRDPFPLVQQERRLKFYHESQADPQVVAYDNTTLRCPTPSRLWGDCISLQDDPNAGFADVECPVFIQLGEHDPILPASCAEDERALYSSSARVIVHPIPGIGHSFNLHLNRHLSWQGISEFVLGQTAKTRPGPTVKSPAAERLNC